MNAESERLADVVQLEAARLADSSRARELASSSRNQEPELASFAEIVRALEVADGRPLYGTGRNDCAAAYHAHPVGVLAAIEEALQANVERRCGLLVRLIRDGFHLAAEDVAQAAVDSTPPNRCGCRHEECRYQDRCLEEVGA